MKFCGQQQRQLCKEAQRCRARRRPPAVGQRARAGGHLHGERLEVVGQALVVHGVVGQDPDGDAVAEGSQPEEAEEDGGAVVSPAAGPAAEFLGGGRPPEVSG